MTKLLVPSSSALDRCSSALDRQISALDSGQGEWLNGAPQSACPGSGSTGTDGGDGGGEGGSELGLDEPPAALT